MSETLDAGRFRFTLQRVDFSVGGHAFPFFSSIAFEVTGERPRGAVEGSALSHLPIGASAWPSSVAAAVLMAREPARVGTGTFLDLGCGAGLTSVWAARMGATVTSVDAHADLAPLVKRNAEAAGVTLEHRVRDIAQPFPGRTFNFVLAADCLYVAGTVTPLADAMDAQVAEGGWALVVCPGRGHLPRFMRKAEARGFDVTHEEVPLAALDVPGARPLLDRHPGLTSALSAAWLHRKGG